MSGKYRAAVIGCGNIGAAFEFAPVVQPWTHASVIEANPQTDLAALVDADVEKLAKAHAKFPLAAAFVDAEEMFAAVKPEIVSIATPTASHKALTLMAVRAGVKAIVCEKPIATSVADGEEMVAACHAAGIPLFINHIRRFDPLIRGAKQRLTEIGEILHGNARYTRGIHNNGTHMIDLQRFFLGEIESVVGVRNDATKSYTDLRDDRNIDGFLFFASGARVSIQSFDAKDYNIFDFDWYGRGGLISLKHCGFRIEIATLKKCSAFIGQSEVDDLNREVFGEPRSFMAPMMQHVVDCLDGRDSPVSVGEDGVAALKVIEALEKSAASDGQRMGV